MVFVRAPFIYLLQITSQYACNNTDVMLCVISYNTEWLWVRAVFDIDIIFWNFPFFLWNHNKKQIPIPSIKSCRRSLIKCSWKFHERNIWKKLLKWRKLKCCYWKLELKNRKKELHIYCLASDKIKKNEMATVGWKKDGIKFNAPFRNQM